ncbi:MAG: BNR-4 repeat-containing protein [Bacteroidota bacterium]
MRIFLMSIAFLVGPQLMAQKPYVIDGEPVEFMQDGGWCWYEDPRAIVHHGKLITGAISGISGDIKVAVYDLKANKNLGTVVLDKNFEVDDHNSPVFYARPDGSLVAVWAMHGKEKYHYYSLSDSRDYLKWSERKVYEHDLDIPEGRKWGGVTYMNLYTIKKQKTLYNFFRDGRNSNPTFISSVDNGATWGNRTHFIEDEIQGKQRPYVRYTQLDKNKIGASFTDGHPRNYGNSIYYAAFDGTSFYKADGTKIKDLSEGPLKTSETDKLYVGAETMKKPEGYGSIPNAAWTCDMENDPKGNPFVAYTVYQSPDDIRFRLANWTGSSWNDREIAYGGPGLYSREDSYSGLMALDPDDPTKLFISTQVNPTTGKMNAQKHEIYMGQIADSDHTETIKWQQVTKGSVYKNIRPVMVSGEGYKVVLWLAGGPWKHFQNYESNVVGYILERP